MTEKLTFGGLFDVSDGFTDGCDFAAKAKQGQQIETD